ncbi:MAG: hypothetical protein GF421_03360 [Candidatus Aminicenantes bacterium]|nr:hypothetical protein [Candidatus Aminicenantes bacterium]
MEGNMRKTIYWILCLLLSFSICLADGIQSLSGVFAPGIGVLDKDEDGLPDQIRLSIIIPENASSYEVASASDLAARANLESLVVDLDLVSSEKQDGHQISPNSLPLILSHNPSWIKQSFPGIKGIPNALPSHQGLVLVSQWREKKVVVVTAGSQNSLLKASRAFFLRWPYLWDVWGKEQGATYSKVEEDIQSYLKSSGVASSQPHISSALYEFVDKDSSYETINRLKFNQGQIKTLSVDLVFDDEKDKRQSCNALKSLMVDHNRGQKTKILSYPGCGEVVFRIRSKKGSDLLSLPRVGYPKRILTPSYKSPVTLKVLKKDFDLSNMLSLRGIYSDGNQDRIPDNIKTSIIIPEDSQMAETSLLASRLVLHTAGASFPLTVLDCEIKEPENIQNPIIIGKTNALYKELVKTGKLKPPDLKPGTAAAGIIPQAFNESAAVVITGSDSNSLATFLDYLSRIFPYFENYQTGNPRLQDIASSLDDFLRGQRGSAEGYFLYKLKNLFKKIKHRNIKTLSVNLYLPDKNKPYQKFVDQWIKNEININDISTESFSLKDSRTVFQLEKDFKWEAEEVLDHIREYAHSQQWSGNPLHINIGISESPAMRKKVKSEIKQILEKNQIKTSSVDVLSSYKQGFFWIKEKIIPVLKSKNAKRLVIRFSRFKENLSEPKRFYSDPYRWLQELYPIDDIISMQTGIPLDHIIFEMKEEPKPVYEVIGTDENNSQVLKDHFSPHTKKSPYLKVLPEWGEVKRTTGWLQIKDKGKIIREASIASDIENFWDFYQDQVLSSVYDHILQKTNNKPEFKKQPYFKRLQIEIWMSEPDFKLGLDEEIISSLEAIHDEIYFDTLDFLRGITDIQTQEQDLPEDSSRYSAPGNVLPVIHPSTEGKSNKVKVLFQDRHSKYPFMDLSWTDETGKNFHEQIAFNPINIDKTSTPYLLYNAEKKNIENIVLEAEMDQEESYLTLIETIRCYRELHDYGAILSPFDFPSLHSIILRMKHEDISKEERVPVISPDVQQSESHSLEENEQIVPTKDIISPQMCLDIVDSLSVFESIHTYIGGRSYEGRDVPVIEAFTPMDPFTSIPRLITFKPTLYCNGRQHANEVCATNYILRFTELLAKEDEYKSFVNHVNFVFHPMENPDGAQLAYRLQKLTPFHSLHAGRYSTLGIDVGQQVNADHPILPEALVRKELYDRWLPDIHLNLHGYPSHEWVQQFSGYSPFLFRDYWIPRGWFVYYRTVSLPIYRKWARAGEDLKKYIIENLNSFEDIRSSNQSLYNRYFRWAARWHPHMNHLEIQSGVNIYSQRRSSNENKLTERRKITFAQQTPELMDETARGSWLEFLVQQGIAYIKAHALYLTERSYPISRIEEMVRDKIHIQFIRSRPGESEKELH